MVARRTILPPHVKETLNDRCLWGSGMSEEAVVKYDGKNITASEALNRKLSREMVETLRDIKEYLVDAGAQHVTVHKDPRRPDKPGAVQIMWVGDIEAVDVAEKFNVGRNDNNVPLIPAWLSLRSETNFDLRWQSPSMGELWL